MTNITITTKTGRLVGIYKERTNIFLGVPFAIPSVNENRFKRAVSLPISSEIIDCTTFKNKAIQPQIGNLKIANQIKMSEDCLHLNIWAPKIGLKKKAVLVWIHGGAFMSGENSVKMFDGEQFCKNGDIVFVSIQYRLGILGFMDFSFLNSSDFSFDSNIGLSDQIEALKWVQENIKYFGGDKSNVTVMGESAGATSILSLISSPLAKNLFHKAICQSPVVESVLSKENAKFWALKAMEIMGLEKNDVLGLSNVSEENVIQATLKINQKFTDIMPGSWPFGPVIDSDLLPNTIVDAFKQNKAMSLPLLIGTNKDEAANFVKETEAWLPSNEKHIDRMFELNPKLNKVKVLRNYESYPSIKALRDIGRDMSFVTGNTIISDKNSKLADTFVYRFDYETIVAKKMNIGAFHGLEIMFAFNNLECELSQILAYEQENPRIIANMLHRYWINFVKNSNPNSKDLVYWNNYTQKNKETLLLDVNPKIILNPDKKGYEIWKDAEFSWIKN
ncbi:MAG: carboxylesterase/lipase family protein [Tenericutes bacterium]|nr:carboxylesterase/lipase family protein [Mycoplasmatota bacterium]